MKRAMGWIFSLALLLLCLAPAALAETAEPRYDASREVAAYLTEAGRNYRLDTSTDDDVFLMTYSPSEAEGLETIAVGAFVNEEQATVMTGALVTPDASDMLKVYQTLEAVNESTSFVRFVYSASGGDITARVELPYVNDGNFGKVVERYVYITALTVDQNYNELAALA